ncbi:hypothetical protein MJM45_30985, partial [Salmonella enterica subsp. enterica serovar Kentucky]|nr:hypothetical protein [Salmonella enterica subsp. enterica serovar Kentucky]
EAFAEEVVDVTEKVQESEKPQPVEPEPAAAIETAAPQIAVERDEFRQLEEQVLEIESGAILVISGSLPPGVKVEKLTQLISAAQ